MAEAKKKAKSNSSIKKNSSKKVEHKKVEHKKENKATKKVVKTENKKEDKKLLTHVKTKNNFFLIIGILVLIIILMGFGIIYLMMNNSNMDSNMNSNNNSTGNNNLNANSNSVSTNSDNIVLTILEDPSCTNCNVDVFADQIKQNLIKNLEVKKIDINSNEGKSLLKTLNAKQVPVYLFSSNIAEREDWASKLASAFVKVSVNGNNEYMLNPQYVPDKVMIEEPKILENAIVYGNKSAKVTIYEFSDYECPFCGIAEGNKDLVAQFSARQPGYVAPMPEVYKNYIDTGKVKLVFYNMPLTQLHPKVRPAHVASLCANEQGKWREFHDKLFADRSDWTESSDYTAKMKEYAKELGLNVSKFDACMDSGKYKTQIDNEIAYGQSLGVSGTPAFYIGKNFISGAQDYSTFKKIIDAQLASSN